MLNNKNILLIITGGIAAYKSLELIRLLKTQGARVRCILTKSAEQFVTPLSVQALSGEKVYSDLWSLTDEQEMGHIKLVREADLIVIAPATANFIAKIANGLADDLASTALLAAKNIPIFFAPAMNVAMFENTATQNNIELLKSRNFYFINPTIGEMACGEIGMGRMEEPLKILEFLKSEIIKNQKLSGKKVLLTAGATREDIDPVRFISNYSSGKQGFAIAEILVAQGADVTILKAHTDIDPPKNVAVIETLTADKMFETAQSLLHKNNFDVAICTAAVADFKAKTTAAQKIKKQEDDNEITLTLTKNPDILKEISNHKNRPSLVIGFAAETINFEENALKKLQQKNCDWIILNDVNQNIFGQNENQITILEQDGNEKFDRKSKTEVAKIITHKIIEKFYKKENEKEKENVSHFKKRS